MDINNVQQHCGGSPNMDDDDSNTNFGILQRARCVLVFILFLYVLGGEGQARSQPLSLGGVENDFVDICI